MNKYAIILAAGKGTRMNSIDPDHSKVSFPILGKPIIRYVIDTIKELHFDKVSVVVGFGGETTKEIVGNDADVVWQKEILGTGHAVLQTESLLKDLDGETLIIYGDTPLVRPETISQIMHIHEKEKNALTVVSCVLPSAAGYGRLIREEKSNCLLAIREETDCSEYELDIDEANTGICVIDNKTLFKYLHKLDNNNTRKLFYLSQLVEIFNEEKLPVGSYVVEDMVEVFGINDRTQLSYAAKVMRKRINHKLMIEGVSMEDPDSTYITPDVKIGKDTVIYANCSIMGDCEIGVGNEIGPNAVLHNVKVGDYCHIAASHLENVTIKNGERVEPYEVRKK